MTASKEKARKANADLVLVGRMLDEHVPDKEVRDEIKRGLVRVQNFVEAAEARLPTEEAIERDRRRRSKA